MQEFDNTDYEPVAGPSDTQEAPVDDDPTLAGGIPDGGALPGGEDFDYSGDESHAGSVNYVTTPQAGPDAGAASDQYGMGEAQGEAGSPGRPRFGSGLCPHCNGTRIWYGEVCSWCKGTGIY